MQNRHAEAAELYREAAQLLGRALVRTVFHLCLCLLNLFLPVQGPDSEYAVEASAGVVRALRAAGRAAEAEQYLAGCSVEVLRATEEGASGVEAVSTSNVLVLFVLVVA